MAFLQSCRTAEKTEPSWPRCRSGHAAIFKRTKRLKARHEAAQAVLWARIGTPGGRIVYGHGGTSKQILPGQYEVGSAPRIDYTVETCDLTSSRFSLSFSRDRSSTGLFAGRGRRD